MFHFASCKKRCLGGLGLLFHSDMLKALQHLVTSYKTVSVCFNLLWTPARFLHRWSTKAKQRQSRGLSWQAKSRSVCLTCLEFREFLAFNLLNSRVLYDGASVSSVKSPGGPWNLQDGVEHCATLWLNK